MCHLPFVARTYAPVGRTPILRAPRSRDHRAAISAPTPAGRRFAHIQEAAVRGETVVASLRRRPRQVRGKLLVIRDGAARRHR